MSVFKPKIEETQDISGQLLVASTKADDFYNICPVVIIDNVDHATEACPDPCTKDGGDGVLKLDVDNPKKWNAEGMRAIIQ